MKQNRKTMVGDILLLKNSLGNMFSGKIIERTVNEHWTCRILYSTADASGLKPGDIANLKDNFAEMPGHTQYNLTAELEEILDG